MQDILHFDVWEIRIEGNTLLDQQTLERTVYSFTGPDKTIDDVELARKSLEQHYRDIGYPTVVVNIPEQDVSKGIVLLNVVEGRIAHIYVSGSEYFSPQRIRRLIPALREGEVPYVVALQRQISAVNTSSRDRVVTPVLRPGRTPGSVEMELKVKDELPLHGNLELNDTGTESTSAARLSASLRYANLWQREHSLSLQYLMSPENRDEVQVLSGTYLMRMDNPGKLLAAYVVHSESDTAVDGTATLGDLNVLGSGDIAGLRWINTLPAPPAGGGFSSFSLGVDYKNFKENIVFVDGQPGLETPIDYRVLSARYSASQVSTGQSGGRHSLRWSVGANFGSRALGNKSEAFQSKRAGADPSFFYLIANLEHQRIFAKGLVEKGLGMRLRFSTQLADAPLISNEQFSAGGASTVRGYYQSQALSDYGFQGSVEISTPPLTFLAPGALQDLRLLYFIDAAWLGKINPQPDETDRFELISHGLGLRMAAFKSLSIEWDAAWAQRDLGNVARGDWRTHIKARYEF